MKLLLLLVLCILARLGAAAQNDTSLRVPATAVLANAVDSSAMAKVYLIRSTGHAGSAINLRMVVDDVVRCKVKNNRYAMVLVEPGTHKFNATTWDKPGTGEKFALNMPVEAGKTYYMTMHIKQKFMGIEITLEEITYNTAAPMLAKYKLDTCD